MRNSTRSTPFLLKITSLLVLLFYLPGFVQAQNKTLGVGIAAPNVNAALHVESPTSNQGFIMPRLTTAQRTAMSALLTSADNGLMLYDTDLNSIHIWNGTSWKTSAQAAGGLKLEYPYKDSVTIATGTPDLFALKYNNAENKRVMRIENRSATNASSALSVFTGGIGIGGFFQTQNTASAASTLYATTNSDAGGALAPVAVYGESTGTGSLGAAFWNQNPANNFPALYVKTLGTGSGIHAETTTGWTAIASKTDGPGHAGHFETTGTAAAGKFVINNNTSTSFAIHGQSNGDAAGAAVHGENTGNGFGVFGKSSGSAFASAAVYGEHTGTGDAAGAFRISNSGSTYSALYGETNGTGPAIFGQQQGTSGAAVFGNQLGTGRAAQFQIQNASNTEAAIRGFTNGLGMSGFFTINNASNTSPGLSSTTNGQGAAISLNQTNNGLAIEMINGGVKYSIVNVETPGAISQIGAIYNITVTGTFTLPTEVPEGTFCMIFNNAGDFITIDQIWDSGTSSYGEQSQYNESVQQYIFLGGKWRTNFY